jgi:hypothetical protein
MRAPLGSSLLLGLLLTAALPARAEEAPVTFLRPHRYAYLGGGLLALTGAGLGFYARGEAARAQTLTSARETTAAVQRAEMAAASANLAYGVAGLTLAYGLLLELLPEPAAEKASLTFHF